MNHEINRGKSRHNPTADAFRRPRLAIGPFVMGVVTAYLLWGDHRSHVLQALPFLILLACPLLHFFMHGGQHGRGGARDGARQDGPQDADATAAARGNEVSEQS